MQQPHILWLGSKTRPILLEPLLIHCRNLSICYCFHYHVFCIFGTKKPCLIYIFLGIIKCLYYILPLSIFSLFYSGVVGGQTITVKYNLLFKWYIHIYIYICVQTQEIFVYAFVLYIMCDITYILYIHMYNVSNYKDKWNKLIWKKSLWTAKF